MYFLLEKVDFHWVFTRYGRKIMGLLWYLREFSLAKLQETFADGPLQTPPCCFLCHNDSASTLNYVGIRISEIAVPKNWDPTEPQICQELISSEHLWISSVCQFFLGHGSCWLRPRRKDHHAIKQRQESNESFAIGQAVVNGLLASIDMGDHDMGLWRIC